MPEDKGAAAAMRFYDGLIRLEKGDPKADYRAAADGQGWTCGDCRFYDPAWRQCSLVEGTIEPSYTCNLWTARLPSQQQQLQYVYNETDRILIEAPQAFKQDLSKPVWIPFLPTPGMFKHPLYGEIEITEARNQQFVQSVKDKVYQEHIPLDAEHETKLSGAVAWIQDMRMNDDGGADALVEFTARGQVLAGGETPQFKYVSPEWFDSWTDPATGTVHQNVIAGGAITTRPFFKDKVLRALVASERGKEVLTAAESDMKKCADCGKMYSASMTACPECGSTKVASEGDNKVPDPKTYAEGSPELQALIDAATAAAKTAAEADVQKKIDDAAKAAADAATKAASEKTDDQRFTELQTEAAETKRELTETKTANETLAKTLKEIQDDNRRRRFTDLVAGKGGENDGGPWTGDQAKHVAFLEQLADKVGETDPMFVSHIEQMNAVAAQAAEAALFTQVGSGAPAPSGGSEQKLESLVKTRMNSDPSKPLDFSAAYEEVLRTTEGAKLYGEIEAAKTRRGA